MLIQYLQSIDLFLLYIIRYKIINLWNRDSSDGLLASYFYGGKNRLFGGSRVGKIILMVALISNITKTHGDIFIFSGVEQ